MKWTKKLTLDVLRPKRINYWWETETSCRFSRILTIFSEVKRLFCSLFSLYSTSNIFKRFCFNSRTLKRSLSARIWGVLKMEKLSRNYFFSVNHFYWELLRMIIKDYDDLILKTYLRRVQRKKKKNYPELIFSVCWFFWLVQQPLLHACNHIISHEILDH